MEIEITEEHIRHIMLYEFNKGNNASAAVKNIEDVYGKNFLKIRKCQLWFKKFRGGDFNLNSEQRSGRPKLLDDKFLTDTFEQHPNLTVKELAIKLKSNHTTIHRHLKRLGKTNELPGIKLKDIDYENNNNN